MPPLPDLLSICLPPRSQPLGDGGARAQRGFGGAEQAEAGCTAASPGLSGAASGEGLLGRDFGKLSLHRQGDSELGSGGRSWNSPGSTPESGFAPAALLPGAMWEPGRAREAEGTPNLLLLARTLRLPSSTAVVPNGICSTPRPSARGWRLRRGALSRMSLLGLAHLCWWWVAGCPPAGPLPPALMGTEALGGLPSPHVLFLFEIGCDTQMTRF